MKLLKDPNNKNTLAWKGGSYSLMVTCLVLAICVAVNVLVDQLPAAWTSLDMSSTQLYSVTSNTKAVVNALKEDVTIYWIVQADQEDSVIENLLAKYESLSSHVKVVKKNPDMYPNFTAQYTDETVSNNSLIVERGSKSRYISYDSIYLTDVDYTTYSYVYSFDGEGAITSAIDYVISDDYPQVYVLEGHGEESLPEEFSKQIEKENMEVTTASLLNDDSILENADCVIIYAPSSDISEEEKEQLLEYIAQGGKLMVMSGVTKEGTLKNLSALLEEYNIKVNDGVVIEADRSHYASSPYLLLPDMQSSEITDPLIESSYMVLLPTAQGLTIGETDKGTITDLFTTSDQAFSKIDGYNITTMEKEENDIDGPFSLGVSIEESNGGQMIYIASSTMLEEQINSYSSGANLDFVMNCLSSLIGETESLSIRSKSLGYNYLTISDNVALLLKIGMIGVLPAVSILIGIVIVVNRRKGKEEDDEDDEDEEE